MTKKPTHSSPCIICGRNRIVKTVDTEEVGLSTVVTTQMVCPDPKCQRKVDDQLAKEKHKREMLQKNKEQRTSSWGRTKNKAA